LSFDVFWFIGWAVLLWLAIWERRTDVLVPQDRTAPFVAGAMTSAAFGIAVYATIILLATILGRTIFTLTTNRKKRFPEEEIVQTLVATLSYVESQQAAWAQPKFRRFVARELNWVADRLEFDFFRKYSRSDDLTAAWSTEVAVRAAAAVQQLKQKALLPSAARLEELRAGLCSMLLLAGRGEWAQLPVADAVPEGNRKSTLIAVSQITLSILIPLAAPADFDLHRAPRVGGRQPAGGIESGGLR
jgi:hypothetical protein